jgi:hypothetical protein
MGILPKIESKSMLVETVSPPAKPAPEEKKVCERFLKRGNEPVASNYEEVELKPIKANDLVIIPNAEEVSKKEVTAPVPFGNVKLNGFEEEVSGINLSKLFSVYGPQSTQDK